MPLSRRSLCVAAVSVAAMCMLGGCPKKSPPPQSPTATTPPTPQPSAPRIVVLSPAVAVILKDLGSERDIVGRHAYDLVLNPSTPVCGDQAGIDYESLIRVHPTHVFTQWGSRALPERLTTIAAEQHWTLRDVPVMTMDDVSKAVASVDRAVRGVAEDAPLSPTADQLRTALANLLHPAHPVDRSRVGKVLLLIGTAPPSALGPGSAHDELLRALGATPALGKDAKSFVELTHEDLIRIAPDAIILFLPRAAHTPSGAQPSGEAGATPLDDPWKPLRPLNLPAITHGHIAVIDDPLGLLPSTGMIPVGEKMRTLLMEWDAPSK